MTEAETMRRLSDLLLDPGGEDSLQSRYQKLEAALITLADTPDKCSLESLAAVGTVLVRYVWEER